jgi:rhodanese-related sulfurtransferase
MTTLRSAAVLLILSLLAAVGTHLWHPAAPVWYLVQAETGVNEVNLADVTERWKNDVVWVDARPQERFDAGHIPGALLINEFNRDEAVFNNLDQLQTSGKPVVVYCDSLKCKASHEMRDFLRENVGLPEVWVLTGGWPAWQSTHPGSP